MTDLHSHVPPPPPPHKHHRHPPTSQGQVDEALKNQSRDLHNVAGSNMDAETESQSQGTQQSNTLLEENKQLHKQVLELREASAQNQARNEDIDRLASQFTTTLAAKEREKLALEEEVARLKQPQQAGQVEHASLSSGKESIPSE
jgi:hypothetical protein